LKFQALESSIDINGAFCLIEKKKEERGEKEKPPGRLNSAHSDHKAKGPTVSELMHMRQIHTSFLSDLNLLLSAM
jgi:hypothetical protein